MPPQITATGWRYSSARAAPVCRAAITAAPAGSTSWLHSAHSQRISEWARNWNAGLTRFLRRRVPGQIDAEDLAQEVYVRLLRVEKLDSIEEPQAYLYRVASNVAAEWRMRACHSKPHSAEELEALVATATPESLIDEAQFSASSTPRCCCSLPWRAR